MRKFVVVSGFLGSGKTTAMMALCRYLTQRGTKAAMISNDLGRQSLADNKLARLAGCHASELTGDCICYQTENLVQRLDMLFGEQGCRLVMSDIPGFGVGALEHVYHTLQDRYPDRYGLAPFTVLTEPRTVELLRSGTGADLTYILHAQLVEADLILLNKCDLLDPGQRCRDLAYLQDRYPDARVMAISAATGEGLEELARVLLEGSASMHRPDIGYGGPDFAFSMGLLAEYYIQYYVRVCCNDFDGNAYLTDLAQAVRQGMEEAGQEIPHLKLLAWEPEGDYAKADLLGVRRPVQMPRRFSRPCTELAVMLNASAVCPSGMLEQLLTRAVEQISQTYGLTLMIFRKECFGMGET